MTRFLPTVATLGGAALAALLFAAPASAEDIVTEQVTLTFDQSALDTYGNVEEVLTDLRQQAKAICAIERPLQHSRTIDRDCVADIMAQAVKSIDVAVLTQAYNAETGTYPVATDRRALALAERTGG